MYKKVIPLFFVPLLATSALASEEQTGPSTLAPSKPLSNKLNPGMNQGLKGGGPSDTQTPNIQNALEKTLLIKETLPKTDKFFHSVREMTSYMFKVEQVGSKLRSATVNCGKMETESVSKFANLMSKLTVVFEQRPDRSDFMKLVDDSFKANPTLHLSILLKEEWAYEDALHVLEPTLKERFGDKITFLSPYKKQ